MHTDASFKVLNCVKPESCHVVKTQENKHPHLPGIDGSEYSKRIMETVT